MCFNLNLVDKASTCFKCEQPILDTLINFKNNHFHDYCLVCNGCDKSLIGVAIYSDKECNPFCIECYTKKEAKTCAICLQLIVPNQISFLFEAKNFHKGIKIFLFYFIFIKCLNLIYKIVLNVYAVIGI